MATAKIILDTRFKSPEGGYIVKLRVTDNRKSKYYPTSHKKDAYGSKNIDSALDLNRKFSEKEFARITDATRRTEKEKEYKAAFDSFLKKANDCINRLDVFTFDAFEALYLQNRGAKDSLLTAYQTKIYALKKEGKIGTAVNYSCAITSLEKFKPGLKFADISPELLKAYDREMRAQKDVVNKKTGEEEKKPGASPTTVSIYLRTLRTLFNEAISDGVIDRSLYPFRQGKSDKRKYSPPVARNIKKALPFEDIAKIYYYVSDVKLMQQAKDFWVLSYLCNGMNMKDILNLRWKNIDGDFIHYERQKTTETKEVSETINVHLKDEAKAIIKRYAIKSLSPESLIFPVLSDTMDAETKFKKAQLFVRSINDNFAKVCKELKISKTTSYGARHSFASTLKKNNASLELIREALGHSSLNTTKNYLASFDDETLKKETDVLIPVRLSSQC